MLKHGLLGGRQTHVIPTMSHPRTITGDIDGLIALFEKIIKEHTNLIDRLVKPNLLVHLIDEFEGGYTTSELNVLQSVGKKSGASMVFLCNNEYGPQPDSELKTVFKAL